MGFMDSVEKELLNGDANRSRTENGALGYRTTGKNLLDLNFQTSSLRKKQPDEIVGKYVDAFLDNKLYALKWLFYLRDAREGLGERRSFRIIMNHLAKTEPNIAKALVTLIPEYGRYDDLMCLFGTECEVFALAVIKEQLNKDLEDMKANKPISLLGKWLPSCNASSKETREKGLLISKYLGLNEKGYRKVLSELRKYLKVVERQMSAKEWDKINYEAVPSRANLNYNGAFLRNDEERRRAYLESLKKGEAKINASVLFPHDIVNKYRVSRYSYSSDVGKKDDTLEALWKALPDLVEENPSTMVIRDGSGSMCCTVDPNSSVTAMDVSTALAIYFAERSSGEFKDKYITFGNRPKVVDLTGMNSLRDKLIRSYKEADCSNTNIEATFNLILNVAIKGKLKQEDMPQNILIVSDMEFDRATYGRTDQTLFNKIAEKFVAHGYKMPRLVFWNVNSRTGTIPVKENELGVALVSGFSVNVVKMVLSGELDPYKCLTDQLDSERYAPVEAAIKDLL